MRFIVYLVCECDDVYSSILCYIASMCGIWLSIYGHVVYCLISVCINVYVWFPEQFNNIPSVWL